MEINKLIKLQIIFGKKLIFPLIVLFVTFSSPFILNAQHEEETHETTEKKFQPGPFIFDHIADSYDWHILTFGENHISLPLPIILYSESKGLNVFMSSKFHHGHDSYKGFKMTVDETTGKTIIVETLSDGSVVKPINISITKNVVALFFSVALMLFIFISIAKAYKKMQAKHQKGYNHSLNL